MLCSAAGALLQGFTYEQQMHLNGKTKSLELPEEGWRKRCLMRIALEAKKRHVAPLELVDAIAAIEGRKGSKRRSGKRHKAAGASKSSLEAAVASLSSRTARKLAKRHARWERRVATEERLAKEWGGNPAVESLSGWWRLVALTEQHRMFQHMFCFPSYERKWIRFTRKPLRMLVNNLPEPPAVLAIDCEFISTNRSSKELASLAAVNECGETVLHRLVLPKGKVKDFKEHITGLNLQSYQQGNPVSWDQARNELVQLLRSKPGTILLGHGVSNDLEVLQLDYRPVIDTSLLFEWRGRESLLPGLQHLHERLVGGSFRSDGTHSPDEDARAALDIASHEMHYGPVGKLEAPGPQDARSKLFVHDVDPNLCGTADELFALLWGRNNKFNGYLEFADGLGEEAYAREDGEQRHHEDQSILSSWLEEETNPHNMCANSETVSAVPHREQKPRVKRVQKAKKRLCADAVFQTPEEADRAFAQLKGSYELDRFGKSQKVLRTPNGGHLRVRKLEPDSRDGIRKRSWARRVRRDQRQRQLRHNESNHRQQDQQQAHTNKSKKVDVHAALQR